MPLRPSWTSAALIAAIISVPPAPYAPSTKASAARRFSSVAGFGSGQRTLVAPAKVMMLKVSFGRIAAIALRASAFDFSIGKPFIEPDTSRTKTSSRGRISAGATRAGGSRRRANEPRATPDAPVEGSAEATPVPISPACAKNAGSIASSATFQRRMKSRFGIVAFPSSVTMRRDGAGDSMRIAWRSHATSVTAGPPDSIATETVMS